MVVAQWNSHNSPMAMIDRRDDRATGGSVSVLCAIARVFVLPGGVTGDGFGVNSHLDVSVVDELAAMRREAFAANDKE